MFGKKLKGNFKNLLKGAKKYENQEFLNGAVALSLMVAFADGNCDDAELGTIEALIQVEDSLSAFSEHEIETAINKFKTKFSISAGVGKLDVDKALKSMNDNDQKEMVIAFALAVAGSDGEVGEHELKVIKDACKVLGVSSSKFGL